METEVLVENSNGTRFYAKLRESGLCYITKLQMGRQFNLHETCTMIHGEDSTKMICIAVGDDSLYVFANADEWARLTNAAKNYN